MPVRDSAKRECDKQYQVWDGYRIKITGITNCCIVDTLLASTGIYITTTYNKYLILEVLP